MNHAIEIENLTKAFKSGAVAVSGLDLALPAGAICGLVGRNGSGKTTAIRLVMGLLRPDAGEARVLGMDLWQAPRTLRQQVAYVSQSAQLPRWMTYLELARYVASFYPQWDGERAQRLAQEWDIPVRRTMSELSSGEQRQAALALALASRPKVLILDEPAAGLDPVARKALLQSLVEASGANGGSTILFSSHHISDLERVVDTVIMLDRGRAVLNARLDQLLESTRRVQVIFRGDPPPDFVVPGTLKATVLGPVVTAIVRLTCAQQLESIQALNGARVHVFPMGLEEIFVELFGTDGRAGAISSELPMALKQT